MRKGKVFFHPIEGTAALTISWTSGPKGDAVEAKKGSGVGFFSDAGELLCVIFDEVQDVQDHQFLEFARYRVEISVKNGKVTHSITSINKFLPKKRAKQQAKNSRLKRRSRTRTRS
jgi:hypothetical protein